MIKLSKPVILSLLILLIAASSKTFAQPPATSTKPRQAAEKKIAVPFAGDNVQSVARALYPLRADLSKTQFETESQFLSRLESKLKTVKYNDKTLTEIVFSFPPYAKYDPNLKAYTIYIGEIQALPGLINYGQPERNGLRLVINRENTKDEVVGRYTEVGGANIRIPMDAAKAKQAFPDLKINIYGLPVYSLTPQMFNFLVQKVVVYNRATGEIYREVTAKDIKYEEYQSGR